MEVYKKINNNVALARDAKGRELVVFGKGIGFASMPYEIFPASSAPFTMRTRSILHFSAMCRKPCFWRRTISPIQPGKNWIAP